MNFQQSLSTIHFELPNFIFVLVMILFLIFNLLSGIALSSKNHLSVQPQGLRNTLFKLSQYILVILSSIALTGIMNYQDYLDIDKSFIIPNTVVCIAIWAEAISTLQNLYDLEPESFISKYLLRPFIIILKLRFENDKKTV